MTIETDIEPKDAFNRELIETVHPPSWRNPTPEGRYNLVVIGGGTAGLVEVDPSAAKWLRRSRLWRPRSPLSNPIRGLEEVGRQFQPAPSLSMGSGSLRKVASVETIAKELHDSSANPGRDTSAALCIFAKPARPGHSKTRLAESFTLEGLSRDEAARQAARLARSFFLDVWAGSNELSWARVLLSTNDIHSSDWRDIPSDLRFDQGKGDLGARMERTFHFALQAHRRAIAIGSDSPGIPLGLLTSARDALHTHDAVIGPSTDGGFYLLGLTRCPKNLLSDLPWSQETTFERTLERLRERNFHVAILDEWFDVDDAEDWRKLLALVRKGVLRAPHTETAATELGVLEP